MEDSPNNPLSQYISQLSAVDASLENATGDQLLELTDLKGKLIEVISLLKGDVNKNLNNKDTNRVGGDVDNEFQRFQNEIKQLEKSESSNSSNDSAVEASTSDAAYSELYKTLSSLEGSKCRAPFQQTWGERAYHNAIIFSIEVDAQDACGLENVQVKVMFCNPTTERMKPCPFFLDGHCRFEDDECRYSHGFNVKYADIEEYILPDYSHVERDSRCLAKYEDDLWYAAIVEKCLDDHKYLIKYEKFSNIVTLPAHDIYPIVTCLSSDSDDDSSIDDFDEPSQNNSSFVAYEYAEGSAALGSWEQHTSGIGSKLMAKMGYVTGQGLGKNSDGRIEPVEAVVFPKGKSLDKCAEIRERVGPQSVEDKFNSEQAKEEKILKRLGNKDSPDSFFEFINKNISSKDVLDRRKDLVKKRPSSVPSYELDKSSKKSLNLEIFSVGEDIKKAKKEIGKLQQSLHRNASRNEAACVQLKQKMTAQSNLLRKLEVKEQKMFQELNVQKSHKKITIF